MGYPFTHHMRQRSLRKKITSESSGSSKYDLDETLGPSGKRFSARCQQQQAMPMLIHWPVGSFPSHVGNNSHLRAPFDITTPRQKPTAGRPFFRSFSGPRPTILFPQRSRKFLPRTLLGYFWDLVTLTELTVQGRADLPSVHTGASNNS